MNALKRKQLNDIIAIIRDIEDLLIDLRDAEYDSYDNLPDNLRDSAVGDRFIDNYDKFDEIISNLEDSIMVLEDM